MKKAEEFFTDPKLSEYYAKYRPSPPPEILNNILEFIKLRAPFNQAVDAGCGSGQATSILSPHFKRVLGIDISQSQIDQALKQEINFNVQYVVGSCESFPLLNETVELVSACAAARWFNLPSFFKEVDRVLVPGGVVALIGYRPPEANGQPCSAEINKIYHDFFYKTLDPYRHPSAYLVRDDYEHIVLPYAEQHRNTVFVSANWSVACLVGFIRSSSSCQFYLEKEPQKAKEAISNLEKNLLKAVQQTESVSLDEEVISIRRKYTVIMSRKPKN